MPKNRQDGTPTPAYRIADTLPPDATIISTMNPKVWIRRDFTVAETANLLSMSEDWIRAMWRDGRFPNGRQDSEKGRIHIPGCDIDQVLKSQRIKAPTFNGRRK